MKKCPFCSEEIEDASIKCIHCDSDLSAAVGRQESRKIKAINHPSYWTFTILGLLLPVVGIIVGIVYLTKDKELERKLGEHVIAISVLGAILFYVFYWMSNFHV